MTDPFKLVFAALILSYSGTNLRAEIVNPWVTSDADVYYGGPAPCVFSMETFHSDPVFKDLKPKDFCAKLFDVYYDGRRKNWTDFGNGLTLWAHTGQEPHASKDVIELDPVLLLNVFGTGYCGIQSGLLEGIYQSRPGGEPGKPAIEARRWFLAGIVHSVCDAYWDGQWHYYDIDLGGYAGDASNPVWSVAEVLKDPKGYYQKTTLRAPYFFKADGNGAWVDKIDPSKSYCFQDNQMLGHEMSFTLRKGETFTRYFSEQAAGWKEPLSLTSGLELKQKGYCEIVYAPTSADQKAEALVNDKGTLIFAVRCPYNITSSKVEATGKVSCSMDVGRTWQPLGADGAVAEAVNHWDYLLKVENGELKKVTTRGMLHPGSLPRVGSKPTNMTVASPATYRTLTWVLDLSSADVAAKVAKAEGTVWKAGGPNTLTGGGFEGRGTITIPVQAPQGAKIVKLSACVLGGARTTPQANNYLELFIGPAGSAKLVGRTTDCSKWGTQEGSKVEHWQTNVNGSASFDPTEKAEVKIGINGYGKVIGVRIYVHFVPVNPPVPSGTLTITHGFDGKTFQKSIPAADLAKKTVTYQIPTGAKQNDFIRIEVK